MNIRKMVSIFFAALICISAAGAQDTAKPETTIRERTVEELYLENIETRIIREQAVNPEYETKRLALENLQDMLDNGKLTADSKDAITLLSFLSMEGTGRIIREGGRIINNYPDIRMLSCRILGEVGGVDAENTLIDVVRWDAEPMVLAEAAYALGKIGGTGDNAIIPILAEKIIKWNITKPDNNFAFATILAFEKIAEKNNGITDQAVFQALVQISQGNYIKDVRMKALEVLDKMRRY
ncbi:MAG: HEAT repeat domain-containing protein [Spirochaetales bacterium]|nr:MAG: HEAT repeat domain-containing protein [Spirochaetales bacterium]